MRKYFAVIAVFVFMICLVGCNAKMGNLFFDFKFDNMQVKVGDEVNIFSLDYSTNVYKYESLHVSSTDEEVVSVLENGDIEALCIGNCKIVVNIVSNGSLVTSSFDVFVVDKDKNLVLENSAINNKTDTENEEKNDESNTHVLSYDCVRASTNVFVLTIFKNHELYYDFGFEVLSDEVNIDCITRYGSCIEVVRKDRCSVIIRIFDLNSKAVTIFNSQDL